MKRCADGSRRNGRILVANAQPELIEAVVPLLAGALIATAPIHHEHARREKDPSYKIWDPNFVLALLKDRDPRIGACADTGHWQTSGVKPLDGIKLLKGRIVSLHLKERAEIGKPLPDMIYGTGASDTAAVLAELKKQRFKGHISIEDENNWDNSVPDIKRCVDFVRNWGTKT